MQAVADIILISGINSDEPVEKRNVFDRLMRREHGAADDCLKEHGNYVWALAKLHSSSAQEAAQMAEEIFADIWKYAERFDVDICDEKAFVKMIALRYLVLRRKQAAATDA